MPDRRNTRFFSKINEFYLGEKRENSKDYLMSANSRSMRVVFCARTELRCVAILITMMSSASQRLRAAPRVKL